MRRANFSPDLNPYPIPTASVGSENAIELEGGICPPTAEALHAPELAAEDEPENHER